MINLTLDWSLSSFKFILDPETLELTCTNEEGLDFVEIDVTVNNLKGCLKDVHVYINGYMNMYESSDINIDNFTIKIPINALKNESNEIRLFLFDNHKVYNPAITIYMNDGEISKIVETTLPDLPVVSTDKKLIIDQVLQLLNQGLLKTNLHEDLAILCSFGIRKIKYYYDEQTDLIKATIVRSSIVPNTALMDIDGRINKDVYDEVEAGINDKLSMDKIQQQLKILRKK